MSLKNPTQTPSSIRGSVGKEKMKKVKYQITKKKYLIVKVENEEEEKLIKELNNLCLYFDRTVYLVL